MNTVMHTFLSHARHHWVALVVAACTSVLVLSPLIAFPFVAGSAYQGINTAHFGTDAHYYLSRMNDALAGHALGQPFLVEGKDAQDPTFSYVERIVTAPVRVLGVADYLDVPVFYNTLNALGVFALILVMYAFIFRMSRDRLLAASLAFFVICGYSVIFNKGLFFTDFNVYGRSPWPWVSSLALFTFLYYLHKSLFELEQRRSLVCAAGFLGLLFYVYFYAWTFAGALMSALVVTYALKREWARVIRVLVIGTAGLVIGAYNLWHLLTFYTSPAGERMAYFLFAMSSHAPIMSKVGLVTAVLAAVCVWRVRRDPQAPFLWAIIAAGWIALNQQVVTGHVVQYGHYYWYFVVPLSIIVAGYFVHRLLPQRARVFLPVALLVVAGINIIGGQYQSFTNNVPYQMREQAYAPILAALNTEPSGIVFAGVGGDVYEFLVTIYTHHDLFWIPAAQLHTFPDGRPEDTLLVNLYLNKNARKDPAGYVARTLAAGSSTPETLLFGEVEGPRSGLDYYVYVKRATDAAHDSVLAPVRADIVRELAARYRNELASPTAVHSFLQERNVRYILWDKHQYPDWDLAPLKGLAVMATSTDLVLYSLEQ